ncbi:MAG: EamA family transporter [Candidatus Marsarchaeota archaeon]|nr:EamA family transporter [Candidatus Marsarchaeota archaeon]
MIIYLVIFITLIAAVITSFSQLLYKKGLKNKIEKMTHVLRLLRNKWIIAGLFCIVLSLAIYLYALSQAPLSVVYPIFASTFIFVPIISVFVLKEKMTTMRVIGMLVVVIGIMVIAATS